MGESNFPVACGTEVEVLGAQPPSKNFRQHPREDGMWQEILGA